jgi:hypothetical protein
MPIPAAFNRATRTVRDTAARMTRTQKLSAAGVVVVGASVLAVSIVPGSVQAAAGHPNAPVVGTAHVVGASHPGSSPTPTAPAPKTSAAAHGTHTTELAQRLLDVNGKSKPGAHVNAPATEVAVKKAAEKKTAHHEKAYRVAPLKKAHYAKRIKARTVAAAAPVYGNNLNGWIEHALAVMKQHGIPGSYNGIERNVMRESSGNPNAINLWDVNAQNGVPSKGLLQVIPPTFSEYHVGGTSNNIYDPVANIVAACNYAAHRYGTIDNVNSAY